MHEIPSVLSRYFSGRYDFCAAFLLLNWSVRSFHISIILELIILGMYRRDLLNSFRYTQFIDFNLGRIFAISY